MNIDIDISTLTPQEFKQYKLVDIREPNEYATLPAATDNIAYIPFAEFPHNINQFNANDNYLLVCAMGGRSHHMAEYLNHQGINAVSVNFGINAVNAYLSKLKHAGN